MIEYGYLDSSDSITAVTTPDQLDAGPDEYSPATRSYNFTTVPQTELDGRPKSIRAGAVVGGSSATNGMLLDRGSAEDYDAWVLAAGEYGQDFASEWGWENILPSFKKSVTFHPPTKAMQENYNITYDVDAAYGGTTPIHASYRPFQWPTQRMLSQNGDQTLIIADSQLTELMFNAFKRIPGIEAPKEAADGSKHGVVWAPNSIDAESQRRSYSKIGHYDEVVSTRDNLHLLPAHRVTKVLMGPSDTDDTWVAEGVSYTPRDGGRGQTFDVKARKEVVLSAGTFHTPQVLQRSGIGPRDVLEAAGVEVKVELPGVGWNFQSHTAFGVSYRFNRRVFPSESDLNSNRTFQREAQRQWDTDKTGPYTAYVNSGVFLPFPVFSNATDEIIAKLERQSPEDYLPRGLDPTLIRGFAVQKEILTRQLASRKSAWLEYLFSGQSTSSAILLHIFSRGTVKISPDDDGLNTPPMVDYRSFTNPIDLDLNVELLKGVRWFMGHEEMVDALRPVETSPAVTGESRIRAWIRRNLNASVAHQIGTAALGPKELGGVVGPDLTVYGTRRLSVADNSAVPMVPGSHTSALAYAMGEKVC